MYYLLCYLHQDIPVSLSANKWFYIIRWTFDRVFVKTRLYFQIFVSSPMDSLIEPFIFLSSL